MDKDHSQTKSQDKPPQKKQKRNIQKPYDKLSKLLRENLLKRKTQQREREDETAQ